MQNVHLADSSFRRLVSFCTISLNTYAKDLSRVCKNALSNGALQVAKLVGDPLTRNDAYLLLQKYEKEKDLECGRRLQFLMVYTGLDSIAALGDQLIRVFAYHGSLFEANQTFNKLAYPTNYTWVAIIFANSKLGQSEITFRLHQELLLSGTRTDKYIYVAVIKGCINMRSLFLGRMIHAEIMESGLISSNIVGNSVVDMYLKCDSIAEARQAFSRLQICDVVSWNTLIGGYIQHEEGSFALKCFEEMQKEGISPDEITFSGILKACASTNALEYGRIVHVQAIEISLNCHVVVGSSLIDMYYKCGSLEEAHWIFDKLPNKNVVSWGAMVAAYCQNNDGLLALECYEVMQGTGIKPNEVIFLSALKACTCIGAIEHGRLVHSMIIAVGLHSRIMVGSTLLDMYAKCGSLEEADRIFCQLPILNVVSWNAMITGYTQLGKHCLALNCFNMMQLEMKPDEITFLSSLKACASISELGYGRIIHEQIIRTGLQSLALGNSLINMYMKCKCFEEAYNEFYKLVEWDVVSWSSIIAGFAQHGEVNFALECFENMQREGVCPNVVTWSALISGLVQCGESFLALLYFQRMQEEGTNPNDITLFSALRACANIGAIEQGKLIYDRIVKDRPQSQIALIDMYAKCGSIEEACSVFYKLSNQNLVSWNMMIAAYAQSGLSFLALECLDKMQHEGINPDEVSFNCVLLACNRSGLVEEGRWYLNNMRYHYGITPSLYHCNSMVDVLGHAGCFIEAEDLLQMMTQINITGWLSLLGSCKTYGNIELGKRCFNQVVLLKSYCTTN